MNGTAMSEGQPEGDVEGERLEGAEYEYEQAMERLRDEHPPAPSELVDDILAYVFSVSEEDLPEQKERIRWFLIGGVVAATVVLAIVGVVLLRRGWIPGPLGVERSEPAPSRPRGRLRVPVRLRSTRGVTQDL